MATILEVLDSLNVPYHETGTKHNTRGWVQTRCPHCDGPDGHHLGWNIERGSVNCWRCGPQRPGDVLVALTSRPLGEVLGRLKGLTKATGRDVPVVACGGLLKEPKGLGELTGAHKRYLKRRGLSPDKLVQLWGIQGIGQAARLKWRIYIPFHLGGRKVSWTTRAISDEVDLRYISAKPEEEAISHKELLYGEDYCRHAIIVHEGPFDVWTTGPGAVATCGISYSIAQVNRIAKYPRRIICFDNEKGAQKRARKLCAELEGFPGETLNVVLSGKDANDSPKEEIKQLRRMLR